MPTHQDETLPQRYAREHQDYLKLCGSMTAEQVADIQLQLHNSLAREQALQQRLTAADELLDSTKAELAWQESDNAELRKRVEVLEGLLRRCQPHLPRYATALRTDLYAALKPAEGLDRRDMAAKVHLLKREGGGDEPDDHDRSSQAYWADQAAQGKPYEQQLREACERNGIDHGLDAE